MTMTSGRFLDSSEREAMVLLPLSELCEVMAGIVLQGASARRTLPRRPSDLQLAVEGALQAGLLGEVEDPIDRHNALIEALEGTNGHGVLMVGGSCPDVTIQVARETFRRTVLAGELADQSIAKHVDSSQFEGMGAHAIALAVDMGFRVLADSSREFDPVPSGPGRHT